jgi:hypothetical protein
MRYELETITIIELTLGDDTKPHFGGAFFGFEFMKPVPAA